MELINLVRNQKTNKNHPLQFVHPMVMCSMETLILAFFFPFLSSTSFYNYRPVASNPWVLSSLVEFAGRLIIWQTTICPRGHLCRLAPHERVDRDGPGRD